MGTRGKPAYRVVVADSRSPRDGAFIEVVGYYNPLTNPETVNLNGERITKWLRDGAKPTDTVERLLAGNGIIEKKQRVYSLKPEKKAEQEVAEAKVEGEAEKPVKEISE